MRKPICIGLFLFLFASFVSAEPTSGIWLGKESSEVQKIKQKYTESIQKQKWEEAWKQLRLGQDLVLEEPQASSQESEGRVRSFKSWVEEQRIHLLRQRSFESKQGSLDRYRESLREKIKFLEDYNDWVEHGDSIFEARKAELKKKNKDLLQNYNFASDEKRWKQEFSRIAKGYLDPQGRYVFPLPIEEEPYFALVGTPYELAQYYSGVGDAIYFNEKSCEAAIPYWEKGWVQSKKIDAAQDKDLDEFMGWGTKSVGLKLFHCYQEMGEDDKASRLYNELRLTGVLGSYIPAGEKKLLHTYDALLESIEDLDGTHPFCPQVVTPSVGGDENIEYQNGVFCQTTQSKRVCYPLEGGFVPLLKPFVWGSKVFILGFDGQGTYLFAFDKEEGAFLKQIVITTGFINEDPFYLFQHQGKLIVYHPKFSVVVNPMTLTQEKSQEHHPKFLSGSNLREAMKFSADYDHRQKNEDLYHYAAILKHSFLNIDEATVSVAKKRLKDIGAASVPSLLVLLKDPNPGIQLNAVEVLDQIGDHRAADPLLTLVSSQSTGHEVQVAAVTALGNMRELKAKDLLVSFVRAAKIRRATEEEAGGWGAGIFLSDSALDEIGKASVFALDKISPFDVAEAYALYRDPNTLFKTRDAALEVLRLREKPTWDFLISVAAHHKNPEERRIALLTLNRLENFQSLDPYLRALEDSDLSIRRSAVYILGNKRDGSLKEVFLAKLKKEKDPNMRYNLVWALGALGDNDFLISILENKKQYSSPDIQYALTKLGESRDPRRRASIAPFLKDRDEAIRITAVRALGQSGDLGATDVLLGQFSKEKKDSQVGGEVLSALAQLNDPKALPMIRSQMRDHAEPHRETAIWALGEMQDIAVVSELMPIVGDVQEKDWVRVDAMRALTKIYEKAPAKDQILNTLISTIEDPEFFIREESHIALGRIADSRAADPLIAYLLKDKEKNNILKREKTIPALQNILEKNSGNLELKQKIETAISQFLTGH